MLTPFDEPLRVPKVDLGLWLMLVALCGGAVYGSWHASKALARTSDADRKKIESAEKSLATAAKAVQSGARPNAAAKNKVESQHTALKKQLLALWEDLYARQKKAMVWPAVANVSEAADLNKLKPGTAIPAAVCKAYNDGLVRRELERIFAKLQLRRPARAVTESAVENLPFDDRPADFEGLVAWSPEDRETIISRYHAADVPSSSRVKIWQEDLWLFESLVDAVGSLNDGATDPLGAALKEIDKLEVAQWATAAVSQNPATIWLPQVSETKAVALSVPGADASDEAIKANRYLDAKAQPLAAGDKQPYAEFKQIFVYLKVVIDGRRLDDLMAALANAALPVETRSLVMNVPPDPTARAVLAEQVNQNEIAAVPAAAAATKPASTAASSKPGDTQGILAHTEMTPWDIVVEIGGVVYLYNSPDSKKLGSGAAGSPAKRSFRMPVAAIAP
jgi:hypothetical protein